MSHLGHDGLVSKWIGGHTGAAPGMAHLIEGNRCQAYCVPQGVLAQLYREIAAHRPGVFTHVGIDTFVDPRLGGGRMNALTTEDYVKIIEIEEREYLLYPSFPIDVAVIRGTVADELGNITMDDEAVLLDQLPLAQAARNSGGIVIAQVRRLARAHSLHPKHVRVPAPLIDVVVVASSDQLHPQTAVGFKPGLSGDLKVPLTVDSLPMGARAVVVRRAAMELVPERAVFELRDGQMTLIEIAPGVDLERDVLAQMEFAPVVAETLELMPDHIFHEKWGKLRSIMAAKQQRSADHSQRRARTEADLAAVTTGV